MKNIAIYVRVSSKKQDTRSQEPDLKRWVDAYADGQQVRWYRDKASGKSMDRPGWRKLAADLRGGIIAKLVVWRMDRLGRAASGLTSLFEKLQQRRVNLVSLRDGVDLSTPAGRLMANVLASVAAYENEVRSERILAGQAAARARGKRWGGSKPGRRLKVTDELIEAVTHLHNSGKPIAAIARAVAVSRPTVYRIIREFPPLVITQRAPQRR